MTKTVSSAIQSITETYNNECSELLKCSSEAIKSMTFDIPKYDLTPIIESLSTVHLENDEEILIKLDDDDVKLINDIDSSLEPKKEKFWTFEKISFFDNYFISDYSDISKWYFRYTIIAAIR